MHLLHASPVASPEFVSLSILLKPTSLEQTWVGMGEPMMLVSPVTTVSSTESLAALKQLHSRLTLLLRASSEKPEKNDRFAHDLYKEDEKQLEELQIFRPLAAHGLGLHYRLIRGDDKLITKLSAQILGSNKSTISASGNVSPSGMLGVVFCVGVSGLPYAHASSPLQHSLSQRMNQCTSILTKAGSQDLAGIRILLSTYLLSDDESRVTNEMADASNLVLLPDVDEAAAKGVMSPMGIKKTRRSSIKGSNGVALDSGVPLSTAVSSADAARIMTQRLTVLSAVETDAFLRKYNTSGQERKANLDLTGGKKSKFRRRKGDARDPDFDNFDYKGPVKQSFLAKPAEAMSQSMPALAKTGQKLQLRQPKKDTRAKASGQPNDAKEAQFGFGDTAESATSSPRKLSSAFSQQKSARRPSSRFVEDEEALTLVGDGSTVGSHASHARIQVNIALNEDLACSYKQAQLSTCSVEGVVQIQVKSSVQAGIPFFLYMRDVSMHIASLQDNKKFAEDVSETMAMTDEDADHKFAVSVPNSDNYFPVLRYKCVPDLHPVPIRVQTRVKLDGEGFCRVALQISSNPNNEASLTDLTISMGVPDDVIGGSLVTQPSGGVWEASKKSVIWCVSELGEGEKFQLQARFEMVDATANSSTKPEFPVLVRAQCLFSQLSGIELEVTDIADVHPADIAVKLARRFRLAHRERS